MSQALLNRWTTDPEYIELLNYLIAKTKDAKSPINIQQFIRDFKEKSGIALRESCLNSRIKRMRANIHSFEHIETDTKVRMLFALSAPVNRGFFKKLSNDAHVEVDENNRITHYKSKSLELKGYHRLLTTCDIKNYWTTDMECIVLLDYLIEETENVKSPLNLAQLARDFKEKSGSFQTANSLEQRMIQVLSTIHSFEHIDTNIKVKLLFALSVPVNTYFLEELKKRAIVEVDKINRITYYKANNEGLELSGDHSQAAKMLVAHLESRWAMSYFGNKDDVVSNTGDEEELGYIDFTTRSPSTFEIPELSKRKADNWVPNSSKRTFSSPDYNSFHSYDDPPKFVLKPFRGSIQEDLNGIVEENDIHQIPEPLQTHDKHNQIEEICIKIEIEESVENKAATSHNSKIKFFEAIQSLILCLDTPSLSWIQSKIHQQIQTIGGSDEVTLNKECVQIVDSLISRMINHSVVNLSEDVESVNLSNFLCYLKAAVLNSKMSGMEGLMNNISELIEKSQNKRVPMEKVRNALRATLDIDGF